MRSATALLILLATGLLPAPARASEESSRLVAKGEVAYHEQRFDDARKLFADAAAADPADPAAPYGLGLAFGRLGQWDDARVSFARALDLSPAFDDARRALAIANTHRAGGTGGGAAEGDTTTAEPKRWELRVGTGIQYDSNVTLDPNHRKEDAAFLFTAGGRYDVVRRPTALVRVDYDFYQSLHPDEQAFDLRANRFSLLASMQVVESLWAGVQGGYDHYALAGHAYLQQPWITPFLTYLETDHGLTQIYYRHAEEDFLGSPFGKTRDGPADDVGLNQVIYLGDARRYLQLGYEYGEETPHLAAGDPWARRYHQGSAAIGLPGCFGTAWELGYAFRSDDYTEPNIYDPRRRTRHDDVHLLHAAVKKPITANVGLVLGYYGTFNGSNLGLFDYRRQVVAASIQVTY